MAGIEVVIESKLGNWAHDIAETELVKAMEAATNRVADLGVGTMKRQIVGWHRLGTPRPARADERPYNVTNSLRKGIYSITKRGFEGSYVAIVGPDQVYGRYLEEGTTRMRPYKFVAPTATILSTNNRAQSVYVAAIRKALKS